jgi:hypothetical protein
MTASDPRQAFDELLREFSECLTEIDRDILDNSIDGWSMGKLAKRHGRTPHALHRRKQELLLEFRDYLSKRGITCSVDIFTNRMTGATGPMA